MGALAALQSRVDSWVNALTGLGTLRDKLTHAQAVPGVRLTDTTLEALYNDDDIAAKIVDKLPREATRGGFKVEVKGAEREQAAELAGAVADACDDLIALPKLREAWIWGRLYGGGAVFVGADDGQSADQPLDEARITSIRFLNVLNRVQLTVRKRYENVDQPRFGEPELFEVNRSLGKSLVPAPTGVLIHESRLIVFPGALTARVFTQSPDGWDDSVLQRANDNLKRSATAWQSVGHLLSDASQGVLKVANLIDLIATNSRNELRTRIEMMDMARSVCRAILVDAERESFERVATSFTGIPEMLDRFMLRDAATAEMPVTVLYGRSPAGLNATGESDMRTWYDTVEAGRADILKPRLERLLHLIFLAKDGPTKGVEPEGWKLCFEPLWQPSDKEVAETLKIRCEALAALVNAQIMLEVEAALTLADEFPMLDIATRQQALKDELAALKEHAGERPELDPKPDPDDVDPEG